MALKDKLSKFTKTMAAPKKAAPKKAAPKKDDPAAEKKAIKELLDALAREVLQLKGANKSGGMLKLKGVKDLIAKLDKLA